MGSGSYRRRDGYGRVRVGTSHDQRNAVYERDGFQCAYCGTTNTGFQIDHVIPFWQGGRNTMGNLVVACVGCNKEKGATLEPRWLDPLLEHPVEKVRAKARRGLEKHAFRQRLVKMTGGKVEATSY